MSASITIKEVTQFLESIAPKELQEDYDNSRLLTGNPTWVVQGILVTLDCTEAVVQEAETRHCNLIIAHHPILFRGIKKLTGANYVERTLIKAIKAEIAIYAIHTNLDNVATGVNAEICARLGLKSSKILRPKRETLLKLTTFVPQADTEKLLSGLYAAGAGEIGNYRNCSFRTAGTGSFLPMAGATPAIGEINRQEYVAEDRVEVIFPVWKEAEILDALRQEHPYEEPAFYLQKLENLNPEAGSGMIGELPENEPVDSFLERIKTVFSAPMIRHTRKLKSSVSSVAVCGGSGSFLIGDAIRAGADVYLTSDVKYHEFFDAEDRIMVVDLGHYEGEVHTKTVLVRFLTKKFTTFAINFSETDTNPISYL